MYLEVSYKVKHHCVPALLGEETGRGKTIKIRGKQRRTRNSEIKSYREPDYNGIRKWRESHQHEIIMYLLLSSGNNFFYTQKLFGFAFKISLYFRPHGLTQAEKNPQLLFLHGEPHEPNTRNKSNTLCTGAESCLHNGLEDPGSRLAHVEQFFVLRSS